MKAMSLAALLACSIAFAAPVASHAEALTGTLKKIQDAGTITLGYREYSMPISYVDNNQKPIGYAMDICLHIVDAVKERLKMPGLKVAYQAVSGPNRIPLLLNGAIDLECGTTTNTKERQREVAFGPTYFVSNITAVTKADSKIGSFADLKGKNVAVSAGTTSVPLLTAYSNEHQLNIRQVVAKNNAEAFLLLSNNRVAAFVLDDIVLYTARANAANAKDFQVLAKESLRQEPYGVGMRKDDPQFKQVVDGAVSALMKSHEIEKIYAKWFTSPIPPNEVNLDFPITDALRHAFDNPNDEGI